MLMLWLIWFQNLIKILIINMLINDGRAIDLYHCDTDEKINEIRNFNDNFERFFQFNNKIYFIFKNRIVFIDDIYFSLKKSDNFNKDSYYFPMNYLYEIETKQIKQEENLKNLKTIGFHYLKALSLMDEILIDKQTKSHKLDYKKARLKISRFTRRAR